MADALADYFSEILGEKCISHDPKQYSIDGVLGKILHYVQLPAIPFKKEETTPRRDTLRKQISLGLSKEGFSFRNDDGLYMYFSKTGEDKPNIQVLCSPIYPLAPCGVIVYDKSFL